MSVFVSCDRQIRVSSAISGGHRPHHSISISRYIARIYGGCHTRASQALFSIWCLYHIITIITGLVSRVVIDIGYLYMNWLRRPLILQYIHMLTVLRLCWFICLRSGYSWEGVLEQMDTYPSQTNVGVEARSDTESIICGEGLVGGVVDEDAESSSLYKI